MRKQTKLVAVLSAAALMAIGMSATAFAATPHWDQEDGEWVYLDKNGDKVADEWKKSNGQWYYLDSDGYMAKDQLIEDDEDKFYVDENGVKVTNAWVSMDNDDLLDDDDVDTVWFYFDNKGKAVGAGKSNGEIKKLSYGDGQTGYFIFNTDGVMLSGWQKWTKNGNNNQLYYLGDQNEGWARTGWQYLDPDDEDIFPDADADDAYDDEEWFYFKSNGKAVLDDTRSIGGKTYIFDENGVMLDLWVYPTSTDSNYSNEDMSTASPASVATGSAFYLEDNGGREKNWIFAYPASDYDDYGDDPYWFYLDAKGKPFRANDQAVADGKLYAVGTSERIDDDDVPADNDPEYNGEVAAKSIKSKTYLFNSRGVMLTGLYKLEGVHKGTAKDAMEDGYYYFTIDGDHSATEGQMVTNKKVTIDVHGDDETYYFQKNGKAYTDTIISGSVYGHDGKLMNDQGDGSTYQIVTLDYDLKKKGAKDGEIEVKAGTRVLMNEYGKIKKSGTVTDVNGMKVTVTDYAVTKEVEKN